MPYNLTGISQNTTGLLSLTQGVNDVLLFGYFGIVLMIGLACVLFLSFYFSTKNVSHSAFATCWLSFILALFLRALDLVPDLAIFVTLIFAAASLAFIWKK